MHKLSFVSVLVFANLAAGLVFADDLTDEELLKLFQDQREAFETVSASGHSEARGLVLVTVDSLQPTDTFADPTVPEMTDIVQDDTKIPVGETGANFVSLAQLPSQTTPGHEALAEAGPTVVATTVFGAFAPEMQVNLNIEFAFDSSTLQADQTSTLVQMCRVMKTSDISKFRIVGHTDAAGALEYNQTLSQLRAEEVQRYLVNDCGLNAERLEAIGLGEQFLSDSHDPKAAVNRRVEFQALS